MGEATRAFAIAKTMEILRAYVRKIEDARGYLDCLSPEGRQIVEDYDKNADGQKTLLLKASGSEDFFSGMPDEAVLAYADVCRKMNERFELNVKEVYPIERLAADKKGILGTLWGALQGEFNENPSGSEILIDMGLNFIPFVGKACDARDIAACLKKLVIERRADEISVWVTLLLTAVGCIPVAGDVVKAGCKAILKGADDIFLTVLKKIDADDAYGAFMKFRSKFASGIDKAVEMVCKWIEEARKSKYGSKVDSVLASAGENLRKAVEFMKERIDEFGERVFKKERKEIIIETSGSKGNWNKNLNKKLEPNKIYKVDGYSYFTDKYGRVNKVSGELKLETKDRNIYQQGKSVEIKDGIADEDQGGHIIARIFNGPGEQINYVPQSAKLNNGEWRAMEAKWKKELEVGKRIDINIKINYNKSSRPSNFDVNYCIKGKNGKIERTENKFFSN